MSVSLIQDMVRSGRITAPQGAELLELRRYAARCARRRAFWRGVRRVLTLGLWR